MSDKWLQVLVVVSTVLTVIITSNNLKTMLYYWADSLTLMMTSHTLRYSKFKMARASVRRLWRDLMVRQCQEMKADHIGFWMMYSRNRKLYVSMVGEYRDSKKLAALRQFGQELPIQEIPYLVEAMNTMESFVYHPGKGGNTKMDLLTAEFFRSSLCIPFKYNKKVYFTAVASWVCKDIEPEWASGSLDAQIQEVQKLNLSIHNLLKHVNL